MRNLAKSITKRPATGYIKNIVMLPKQSQFTHPASW